MDSIYGKTFKVDAPSMARRLKHKTLCSATHGRIAYRMLTLTIGLRKCLVCGSVEAMFQERIKSASKSNCAFNLMELIVVLAVVAVLMVIVISAHAAPRNRVYQITDSNNNRRIMQAMISYASDHNGTLPESGWASPAGSRTCWVYGVPSPGVVIPGGSGSTAAQYQADLPGQLAAVTNGQLFPYLLDSRVFMCPADRPDSVLFWARKIQITSYTWNGAINGYSTLAPYKFSQFRPDAILQWETDEKTPLYFNDAVNYPSEGISGRHGTNVLCGMFGGGVTEISRATFSSYATVSSASRLWCNPGTVTGH